MKIIAVVIFLMIEPPFGPVTVWANLPSATWRVTLSRVSQRAKGKDMEPGFENCLRVMVSWRLLPALERKPAPDHVTEGRSP